MIPRLVVAFTKVYVPLVVMWAPALTGVILFRWGTGVTVGVLAWVFADFRVGTSFRCQFFPGTPALWGAEHTGAASGSVTVCGTRDHAGLSYRD